MSKPYTFVADTKPFKMQLEEGSLTGYVNEKTDCFHRFTRPLPLKNGDVFSYTRGKVILNGKVLGQATYPGKKRVYKIGWAAKKIRLAVFQDGKHWMAADTRSYNVSQGSDPLQAIKSLFLTLRAEDEMAKDLRRKGKQVIRWHVERTPGTKKELLNIEKRASKRGLLLDGVEWK
jgi:hypothetical protein